MLSDKQKIKLLIQEMIRGDDIYGYYVLHGDPFKKQSGDLGVVIKYFTTILAEIEKKENERKLREE
jgi:hypothetical protein